MLTYDDVTGKTLTQAAVQKYRKQSYIIFVITAFFTIAASVMSFSLVHDLVGMISLRSFKQVEGFLDIC